MGTPVPLRSRERECKGVDQQIHERKLTEEEIARYHSPLRTGRSYDDQVNGRSDEMKKQKLEKPSKEQLIEMLKPYPNQYRASYAIAQKIGVSHGTIDNWIKAYGITGIWNKPEETRQNDNQADNAQAADQESCGGAPEDGTKMFDDVIELGNNAESNIHVKDEVIIGIEYLEDPNDPNRLTLAAQPGNGQIHYPIEDELTDEFMLKSETYKSGTFEIEVRHDVNMVVICDIENCDELCVPFEKVNAFAGNLQNISNMLKERQEK